MIYRKTILLPNRLTRIAQGTPVPEVVVAPVSPVETQVPQLSQVESPPVDLITPALEEIVLSLGRAVQEIRTLRDRQQANVREIGVELAFMVARKILGDNISRFPIEETVREAAGRWSMRGVLKIHLHPEDLELLRARVNPENLLPDRTVHWIPDANVSRGDCRLAAGDITTETDWRGWLEEARKSVLEAGEGSPTILD